MDTNAYNKWIHSLKPEKRIKYFVSLKQDSFSTKKKYEDDLDKLDSFQTEIRSYMRNLTKYITKPTYKQHKINNFSLDNCLTKDNLDYIGNMKAYKINIMYENNQLPDDLKYAEDEEIIEKINITLSSEEIQQSINEITDTNIENFREEYSYEGPIDLIFKLCADAYKTKETLRLYKHVYDRYDEQQIHHVPKGTIYYTGKCGFNPRKRKLVNYSSNRLRWVVTDKNTALTYALNNKMDEEEFMAYTDTKIQIKNDWEAYVYKFKTKKDIKLLNINQESLYKIKIKHQYMTRIIEQIFPINKRGYIARDSAIDVDQLFSLFLCTVLKVDGYYYEDHSGVFYTETMICDIPNTMNTPEVYIWKGKELLQWIKDSGASNIGEKIIFYNFYINFAGGF